MRKLQTFAFPSFVAFRNVPMAKEDLRFLGFTWKGKYYINSSMAFGSASSCKIFERIASVLQWIVTDRTAWEWISHYLDDFPMLGKSKQALQKQIEDYMALMHMIGMPVAETQNNRSYPIPHLLGTLAKSNHYDLASTGRQKAQKFGETPKN